MLENGRKIFKQLTLMEDAMLIHRIMRAPEKRVFKIDVGNIPPREIEQFMQRIINKMKKTPVIDQNTGEYNLKYNVESVTGDYFLPVRGGDSGTEIDTLPGLSNNDQIDDIEYLRNKLMASLSLPKAFLGYEEGLSGGKATLAAEDVRFARTIERLQKIIVSELTKIGIVHLYSQGFDDSLTIIFCNLSIVRAKRTSSAASVALPPLKPSSYPKKAFGILKLAINLFLRYSMSSIWSLLERPGRVSISVPLSPPRTGRK
jgi:hypothetical protein